MFLAATTSLNCFASSWRCRTMSTPPRFNFLTAAPLCCADLLIHCTTARAATSGPSATGGRCWFADAHGWSVGLVSSPPAAQKEAYNAGDGEDSLLESTGLIDLRGRTSLMQLAGACRQLRRSALMLALHVPPLSELHLRDCRQRWRWRWRQSDASVDAAAAM